MIGLLLVGCWLVSEKGFMCPDSSSSTFSLVGRVESFCCRGLMVELNTTLESAWSRLLISKGLGSNIGTFDELE